MAKGSGTSLVGGRPQGHIINWPSHPGQVPGISTPVGERPVLDPEIDNALNAQPPKWSSDRMFEQNTMTPRDIIKGLGFTPGYAERLIKVVAREIVSAPNRLVLMKSLNSWLLNEGLAPNLRPLILARATKLYARALQKSGGTEVWEAEDLELLQKSVKYTHKVQKNGKTRYYYDEKKYAAEHGTHTTQEQGTKALHGRELARCLQAHGEKGCDLKGFTDLAKQYGAKEIHDAVKAGMESGDVIAFKGRFYGKPDLKKLGKEPAPRKTKTDKKKERVKKALGPRPTFLDKLQKGQVVMGGGQHKYISKEKVGSKWVYKYAQDEGGKVVPHAHDPNLVAVKLPKAKHAQVQKLAAKLNLEPPIMGGKYSILSMPKAMAETLLAPKKEPQLELVPPPAPPPQPEEVSAPEPKLELQVTQDIKVLESIGKDQLNRIASKAIKHGENVKVMGQEAKVVGYSMDGKIAYKAKGSKTTKYARFGKMKVMGEVQEQAAWDTIPEGGVLKPTGALAEGLEKAMAKKVVFGVKDAQELHDAFKAQGVETYVVGGLVRDLVYAAHKGEPINEDIFNDVDMNYAAPPVVAKKAAKAAGLTPHQSNDWSAWNGLLQYGEAKSGIDLIPLNESGAFNGTCVGDHDLKKNAQRNDFACNALYYDPHNKVVLDSTGGQGIEDAKNKVLRLISSEDNTPYNDAISMRYFKFRMRGYSATPETRDRMHKHLETALGSFSTQKLTKRAAQNFFGPGKDPKVQMKKLEAMFKEDGAEALWKKVRPVFADAAKKAKYL